MRRASHIALMTAAMMATSNIAIPEEAPARQPVKPEPKTQERLTKAEKKRARKAAQRARLAAKAIAAEEHVCDGGWACHFHDVKKVADETSGDQ